MSENNPKYRTRKTELRPVIDDIGRIPPQALDIEEAVLGAIMLEKDAFLNVADSLKPEIFYKEAHQIIFQAIQSLSSRCEPIDILTVTQELRKQSQLEIIGGPYFLTQLTNRVASAANIEYHVKIIQQKYIQRELIHISSTIIRDAYEDTTDCFELLERAETLLMNIDKKGNTDFQKIEEIISDVTNEIELISSNKELLTGTPSGFTDLDRLTGGWQKSDLIIIAGRPGMGKTAFVLHAVRNAAIDFKKRIGFFSLEMGKEQLVKRLLSSETGIYHEKFRNGNMSEDDWSRYNSKIQPLIESNIYIDDSAAISLYDLRAKSRRIAQKYKVDMIVIDYMQLMKGERDRTTNREQEISSISQGLKAIAKELKIPVIALSQLSRNVEQRGGYKRPQLSDLRESGSIEQDADLVLFLYRPEYYDFHEWEDGTPTRGQAEVIIAKHRNGSCGSVKIGFVPEFIRFEDFKESVISKNIDYQFEPNNDF